MVDRTIASRPSLEQIMAIVDFMEKHTALALGNLRGLEGRHESKQLWAKLTRIVNGIEGPTRPMKSWIKFWADKKSTVRSKVLAIGDPNNLCSNIEKKIWDLFLASDHNCRVKQETHFIDESTFNDEENIDNGQSEPAGDCQEIVEPISSIEERQMAIMEKLVKVMTDQATALSQMASASQAHSRAMERLAEASHIQAQALNRLATTLENAGGAVADVSAAISGIDASLKRFYEPSPS
ncbi:hypothetical protein ACJJTC_009146 [Scirpophaga incertulas]